uniref:Uncharacterized protein n=1 Tax=Opuntia streptacantha TaxID=393608 RepID=A0A7C9A0X9_OPUST
MLTSGIFFNRAQLNYQSFEPCLFFCACSTSTPCLSSLSFAYWLPPKPRNPLRLLLRSLTLHRLPAAGLSPVTTAAVLGSPASFATSLSHLLLPSAGQPSSAFASSSSSFFAHRLRHDATARPSPHLQIPSSSAVGLFPSSHKLLKGN